MEEKVIQIPAEIGLMAAALNALPLMTHREVISIMACSGEGNKEVHLCDKYFAKAFKGWIVSKGPHCDQYDRKWIVIDGVNFFCLVDRPKAVKEGPVDIVEGAE